jgi:hypothetical protein
LNGSQTQKATTHNVDAEILKYLNEDDGKKKFKPNFELIFCVI